MDTSVEQRVLGFFQSVGAMPRPGVTSSELHEREQRLGQGLPPDVARFYSCMNGTTETAEWLFEVWPVQKIGSVPDVVAPFAGIPDYSLIVDVLPNASEYFAFADCMIWVARVRRTFGASRGYPGRVVVWRNVRCCRAYVWCVLGTLPVRARCGAVYAEIGS